MMKFVRSIPLAISGLSLALAALGNLLLPYGAMIRYICGILSAIVLIVFALKVFLDSPHARAELKTPVPLSVLPTSTMALMLLCTYIRPFVGNFAVYLWYAAIAVHLCIMLIFFKRFVIGFKIETVYPSWFVAFVGLVVISVTAPAMGAVPIGQAAFYVGFTLYFIALALIVYKMTRPIFVLEPLRLTTAIFTAPMSLLIVGYFSSFELRNTTLIYIMLTIAVLSYFYVMVKMLTNYLKVKFYPTYSAFTFPLVISATAFRLGNNFLAAQGYDFLAPLAIVSEWIAVAVVLYVFVHYIQYFRYVLKF
jgi:exfoliative toxin A/B